MSIDHHFRDNRPRFLANLKDRFRGLFVDEHFGRDEAALLTEPLFIEDDGGKYMQPGWCAGYARRATERVFGWIYQPGHAWNLRYHHQTLHCMGLQRNEISKNARRGYLLGIFEPHSEENTKHGNTKVDEEGKPRAYTHVVVYLGENAEGKERILHNCYGPLLEELSSYLERRQCEIREIIFPKRRKRS